MISIRFLFFLLLFLSHEVLGQKVALVLSGGGARGLAHVGVLKALEEHNIPIDFIVGTSMGGVVGGFYAAGYSADQIEQIVRSAHFQDWVNGNIGDKYNYFYSKENENASWLSLNLEVDSTLYTSFNSNIANDLALNLALTELLAQSSEKANYNFDSLFIPYRAVAADIFTQSQVILKSGGVNEAIRATLTVPFFYKPIKIDDKYLFDGGVYNNFPVDVAIKEFNPDVIIGVNVSAKKHSEYPYQEDDKLISQSLMYLLLDKADPGRLRENDIYIEPNLTKYTGLDFKQALNIVDSGYVEANRQMFKIKESIIRRKDCELVALERNEYLLSMKPLLFTDIKMIGFRESQKKYIRTLFNSKKEILNIHDIKSGYYKLASEEYFKNIYPNIVYNDASGGFEFELYGRGKKNLKIEGGGNIATRSISQIYFGVEYTSFNRLLYNYGLNFYTGRFYQSMQFRNRINLPIIYQFYLEPEFTVNHWNYLGSQDILFDGHSPPIIDQIDRKLGINIGLPIGVRNKLLFKSSYFRNTDRFSNVDLLVSTDTLDVLRFEGLRQEVSFSRNSLNRKQYPSSGSSFKVSINHIRGSENYAPGNTSDLSEDININKEWLRLNIQGEQYFKIGSYSYGYYLEGGVSNQPFFTNLRGSLINSPAFFPLQDSRTLYLQNFRAFNYVAAGLRNVFALRNNLDIRFEIYAFKPLQNLDHKFRYSDNKVDLTKIYLTGTAGAVYHTPLGPISLSINYYDDPKHQVGFLMHFGYIIFNKRSLE
ncbi:patatin-like phospholipase family protein [soil metagenome]